MKITDIFKARVRAINTEYKQLVTKLEGLEREKQDIQLYLLSLNKRIYDLNKQIEKLEEEIIRDLPDNSRDLPESDS